MDRLKDPALKELVERLECEAVKADSMICVHDDLHQIFPDPTNIEAALNDAAQAIRQLCAENEGLREALDYVSDPLGITDLLSRDKPWHCQHEQMLVACSTRAHRALSQPKEPR